jgi:3,4-dihydroxy 2-butanone 4-phosphate synthase
MFTGIVKYVCDIILTGSILKLYRNSNVDFDGVKLGDSVCINGVCVTVISIDKDYISFFVMSETMTKTTFGIMDNDIICKANLEFSLSRADKYDGHFVLGHVNSVAIIKEIIEKSDGSYDIYIKPNIMDNIIKYDCIAINGISLTIADVTDDMFKVSIIPHTYQITTVRYLKVGDPVNMEINIHRLPIINNLAKTTDDAVLNAITQLQLGKPVIVMDDLTRENEGDLIIPAQFMTTEMTTFFVNNTTGILCVSLEKQRGDKLKLCPLVSENTDPNRTPFGIPCDYKSCRTGVSSYERTMTISNLANNKSTSADFTKPGHTQILISSPAGLFDRRGHTEASIELCK